MADEPGSQDQMTDDETREGETPSPPGAGAEPGVGGPPPPAGEQSGEGTGQSPSGSSSVGAAIPPESEADRSTMLAGTRDRLLEVLSATDRAAESILDAARAEAEEAVRAARVEADEHVRSTHRRVEELTRDRMNRLSAVTEDLLGQAETVRQQVEALRRALDTTTDSLATELGLPDQTPIESTVVPEAPQLSDPSPPPPPSAPPPPPETFEDEPAATFEVADTEPAYAPPPTADEQEPKQGLFSRFRRSKPEQASTGSIDSNAIEILIMQMLAGGADRTEIEHRLRTEFQVDDPAALLNTVGPFATER